LEAKRLVAREEADGTTEDGGSSTRKASTDFNVGVGRPHLSGTTVSGS